VLLDAALLYAGDGSVLSHWTAAQCWKLRTPKRAEIHVTTPAEHQVRPVAGRLVPHRSSALVIAGQRVRGGRALTSLDRTVIDIAAATGSRREIRAMTADVVQRGLTTPRRLATELAQRPTMPGVRLLNDVLAAVSEGAHSVLEIELAAHLAASPLPAPLRNARVAGASGAGYRADALWPHARLIVEVDGREWHLSPDDWERDLERMADLTDAGYLLLRFSAAAIRRRTQQTLAIIARQLARRVTYVGA